MGRSVASFDEDQWVEHNGTGRPVAKNAIVDIRWNNGAVSRAQRASDWEFRTFDGINFWTGPRNEGWIVAFRPSKRPA